jgi:glutamyl-tRNA synthetase
MDLSKKCAAKRHGMTPEFVTHLMRLLVDYPLVSGNGFLLACGMDMTVRTRFAPSPTGYLHVGGARTALFCWLFARKHGGQFVLRVEDTDEARNTDEAKQAIFDGMSWLGLDWDEGPGVGGPYGPYFQSERNDIYDRYFQKLVDADRVYESEGAWRFRFERKPITMHDLVCGEVTIDYRDESNTPDMVVRRSDGSYVFHFVNVVDDLEMKITHVIRGEDHLMNTPKHLQLFEALGAVPPKYAHIPLIQNQNGSKMSKRDQGAAVGDYPRQGFVAPALVNFLALLGWSPKTEEEIFTLEDLTQRFSLEAVNRAPARFDVEKCAWMNQQHLLRMSDEHFAKAAAVVVAEAGLPVGDDFSVLAKMVKEKVRLLSELPDAVRFLLEDEFAYDVAAVEKVKSNAQAAASLTAMTAHFSAVAEWSSDAAKESIAATAAELGVKAGQLMFPLRVALSGKSGGPDLGEMLAYLGRERSVSRLQRFIPQLSSMP